MGRKASTLKAMIYHFLVFIYPAFTSLRKNTFGSKGGSKQKLRMHAVLEQKQIDQVRVQMGIS